MDFQNQNILITGATGNIGQKISIDFAKFKPKLLILTGKTLEKLKKIQMEITSTYPNVNVSIFPCNMLQISEIEKLIHFIITQSHQMLNIFVGCHGIHGKKKLKITETESNEYLSNFDEVMQINLHSYIYLINNLVRIMPKKSSICFITGIFGKIHMNQGIPLTVSKASLEMFSKCSALDLGQKNIRINTVSPGIINPEFLSEEFSTQEELNNSMKTIKKKLPLKKLPTPEMISNSVLYLCSTNCEGITGQEIVIDGGLSLLPGNET